MRKGNAYKFSVDNKNVKEFITEKNQKIKFHMKKKDLQVKIKKKKSYIESIIEKCFIGESFDNNFVLCKSHLIVSCY